MSYLVVWAIDSEARTPIAAAVDARTAQEGDSQALVFEVYDKDTGDAWRVDLSSAVVEDHDHHAAQALGALASALTG